MSSEIERVIKKKAIARHEELAGFESGAAPERSWNARSLPARTRVRRCDCAFSTCVSLLPEQRGNALAFRLHTGRGVHDTQTYGSPGVPTYKRH